MIIWVCLLYIFCCLKAFFQQKEVFSYSFSWKILVSFIFVSLVIIVTYRSEDTSDYMGYYLFFQGKDDERYEFLFVKVVNFIHHFASEPLFFFFIFALLSVFLRLKSIVEMSPFFWLSMIVYLSNTFILHEMIQIRAAIASSLLLWSIKYIYKRNLLKFIIIFLVAFGFHYSALVILPLWILNSKYISKKIYLYMIFISYAMSLCGISVSFFISIIPVDFVQMLWAAYSARQASEAIVVDVFSLTHMLRLFVAFLILLKIDLISSFYKEVIILTKIYMLSLFVYILFVDVPVVSYRISEFYQIVEIILIPLLVYGYGNRWGKCITMVVSFLFLFRNIFIAELLL